MDHIIFNKLDIEFNFDCSIYNSKRGKENLLVHTTAEVLLGDVSAFAIVVLVLLEAVQVLLHEHRAFAYNDTSKVFVSQQSQAMNFFLCLRLVVWTHDRATASLYDRCM